MDTIEESAPVRRQRRRSVKFRARTVQECVQSGVSIATIVLYHRLNANLLWRWIAEQEARNDAPEDRELMRVLQGEFISLRIDGPTVAVPNIQIEIRCGVTTISLRWSRSAAAQCAQWLQGRLR